MRKPTLIASRLREVLDYDHATGVFRWRALLSNRVKIGDIAGSISKDGYRRIRIDGRKYLSGRLVWFYMTDCWPENEIDHKNTIRYDDRFSNLRDVTPAENRQNMRRARRDNKTGMLGVSPFRGRFLAQIRIDGKQRYIGHFTTPEKAHAAYVVAKRQFHSTCTI